MALTGLHGRQGKVLFATGAVSNVLSWSANATAEVVDSSVMSFVLVSSATHWKEYLPGFLDWTATIECDLDSGGLDPDLSTDFALDTNGIAVVLYTTTVANSGRMYSGNGMVTSISPSADKGGIIKVTYTVQGSGALVEAASA